MKKYSHWIFIAAVVVLPITVFAIVRWYQDHYTPLPVLVNAEHRIADFNLVTQDSNTASLKDWNDKIVVANFFFTHCPVVCPKMMRNMKNVQAAYKNDNELQLASFSVDPERDTAGQLRTYADRMDIRGAWQLLTGDKKAIYTLARNSFLVAATDGDGGPDDFIHSEKLVLVDKQKRIRGYYNGTDAKDADRLIHDISRLKKED